MENSILWKARIQKEMDFFFPGTNYTISALTKETTYKETQASTVELGNNWHFVQEVMKETKEFVCPQCEEEKPITQRRACKCGGSSSDFAWRSISHRNWIVKSTTINLIRYDCGNEL